MSNDGSSAPTIMELLVEDAGAEGCLGHVPALPGFCVRAGNLQELSSRVSARVTEYGAWLLQEGLSDLTPSTELLRRIQQQSRTPDPRIAVSEIVPGGPVWESGNAAALFQWDLQPLDDDAVAAYLRFVRRVLDRIRDAVAALSVPERTTRPAPDRRSLDETLEHVGNCVWWYCSRIDDDLPEPEEIPDEDQLDRIDRLYAIAEEFLLGVPLSARATVHVPTRFPTADPNERWTHTKACRRQAEHAWTHLVGLKSAVGALEGTDAPTDE